MAPGTSAALWDPTGTGHTHFGEMFNLGLHALILETVNVH